MGKKASADQEIILAIDTSTEALVVAIGSLGKGDTPSFARDVPQVLGSYSTEIGRKHLELSVAMVKEIIDKAGIRLQDLNAVAVGLGPGSLIGSRIGLMIAKTLAQVLKIPLIGISTPQALTPEGLIKMGFEHFKQKHFSSIYDLEPIYLRGPI